jgi:Thioredoxin reductase
MLARNGVPFEFYAADSAEGRQLISEHGIDVRRLPAVIHHGGQVWHDPSFAEVAEAHGIDTRPAPETYDLAVVGAGPAGLSAAVWRIGRIAHCPCWKRTRSGARPAQAP